VGAALPGGASGRTAALLGGDGSDFKRKTTYNGEQQIYWIPLWRRGTTPLGSTRSKFEMAFSRSLQAARLLPEAGAVHNEYMSGILTTQSSFSQKYGYFEIRSKIPVGTSVWPAFWMLADTAAGLPKST